MHILHAIAEARPDLLTLPVLQLCGLDSTLCAEGPNSLPTHWRLTCTPCVAPRLAGGGSVTFVAGVLNRRPGKNCAPLARRAGALEGRRISWLWTSALDCA